MEIPYSIIIGEDELNKSKVKLKNMKTGEEKLLNLKDVALAVEYGKKTKKSK